MLTDMNSKFQKEGLTFDDVLLIPAKSGNSSFAHALTSAALGSP